MDKCNKVEASCVCRRDKEHEGPHACTCGGAWSGSSLARMLNRGVFEVHAWPVREGLFEEGDLEAYAETL